MTTDPRRNSPPDTPLARVEDIIKRLGLCAGAITAIVFLVTQIAPFMHVIFAWVLLLLPIITLVFYYLGKLRYGSHARLEFCLAFMISALIMMTFHLFGTGVELDLNIIQAVGDVGAKDLPSDTSTGPKGEQSRNWSLSLAFMFGASALIWSTVLAAAIRYEIHEFLRTFAESLANTPTESNASRTDADDTNISE